MTDSDLQINFVADASGVVQGTNQAKSAVDDFGAKIQTMAGVVGTLGEKLKTGLEGFQTLAKGLSAAGGEGAAAGEGLAALADAGGAAVGVALALGQVALEAAGAIAEWAARTANSSTASAEARTNATALNSALKDAQGAFGKVGDVLANAFAPVMTEVVKDLKGMAEAFVDNYKHGGEAKVAIDALVIGVKGLVTWIDGVITWNALLWDAWKAVWGGIVGVVEGAFKAVGDDASAVGRVFNDLGGVIKSALSGDVKDGVAALRNLMTDATDAAKQLSAPFGDIGKNTLNGATASVDRMGADITALIQRAKDLFGAGAMSATEGGSRPASGDISAQGRQKSAGAAQPAAADLQASDCGCDPAVAEDRAAQTQAVQTAATTLGAAARTAIHTGANAAIMASDQAVTIGFVNGKQIQANVAVSSDDKIKTSGVATARQLTDESNKALKQFETAINGVISAFSKGFAQLIEGGKSFGQVMRGVGQQILNDLLRFIDGMVSAWARGVTENVLASTQGQALLNALGLKALATAIAQEHQKTAAAVASAAARGAAQTASNASETAQSLVQALQIVKQDAGKTFAGIFAALSQNPATLPAAPAVAAAGMASVLSVSVAAGGFDIPAGLNPLTQLHSQEMVLPARLANPMRDMLANFSGGSANRSAAAGGDVHNHTHNWSVTAMDGPSVERFLRTHGDRMVKVLNERARANAGVALGYAR